MILAGGDVNYGREIGQRLLKNADYDPLAALAPLLATADLRFANLECPISEQGGETESPHNHLVFTAPPVAAEALVRARLDVVSVANNHVWDYGKSGFLETLDHLQRVGLAYAGASAPPGAQYEPASITVQGWRVAIFAVTQIWNQGPIDVHEGRKHVAWAAVNELVPRIKSARASHDVVLVSYHGGAEYGTKPMQWTRDFARQVIAAGADALIGHHPHVPQGVAFKDERPVIYSLGNLVFPMHIKWPWTGTSFLARFTFRKGSPFTLAACPYTIVGSEPRPLPDKTRAAITAQLRRHLSVMSLGEGSGTDLGEPGADGCFEIRARAPAPR